MTGKDNKASAQSIEPIWTNKLIAKHVRDAILTLIMLPEITVQKYLNAWPEIRQILNTLASKKFGLKQISQTRITADAILQLECVLEWMYWIDAKERKLIWMRAARVSWKTICREFKCCRSNVSSKLAVGLIKIASCLNVRQKN